MLWLIYDIVPAAQRASYSAIIDDILSTADLDSISAKAIRKGLQAKVDYDLSEQKVYRRTYSEGDPVTDFC